MKILQLPQARLVPGRWLVRAAGQLARQHHHGGRRDCRHRGRDVELQRQAGDVGAQARALGVAPQPIVGSFLLRVCVNASGWDADQMTSWSKQLIEWDKEDRLKAEQDKVSK